MTRIATDIGGTFTDIVWVDDQTGQVRADKSPTTPDNVVDGVLNAYQRSHLDSSSISLFLHGSTVATNALITQRGATTGLITTKGFRDILEIRRIDRPDEHIYNIFWEKPRPLVPRYLRLEVEERMTYNGEVTKSLDPEEVRRVAQELIDKGAEAIAVCLLHAYANPDHEIEIGGIIAGQFPSVWVSLSHNVAREIREYERTSSTAIDAYIKKPVVGYLQQLETRLKSEVGIEHAPLIANSTGGVSTVASISDAPIQMIESGPAGGAIGAQYLASALSIPNIVTGDVGGTSYDVSIVVDGSTQLRSEHDILGYAAKVPSIDVRSVGAGGGSIARVDSGGRLHVGPESAGADPGPMAFDKGGANPTVTDAALVTGLIDSTRFAGGEMPLNTDLASQGVSGISDQLGISLEKAAEGILTLARTNMANVTRQILVGQGHDPRDFTLLGFGGGGGLFAVDVAKILEIPGVIIPPHPAMFSAWGMLNADIVGAFARSYVERMADLSAEHVKSLFAEMENEARDLIAESGIKTGSVVLERAIDARYSGQGHEVEVPATGIDLDSTLPEQLADRFDSVHETRYGHRMQSDRETVTFRLRAYGQLPRLQLPVLGDDGRQCKTHPTVRGVFLEGAWAECPVRQRESLGPATTLPGPLLIEEPSHVTVIGSGDSVRVDDHGFLHITLGG